MAMESSDIRPIMDRNPGVEYALRVTKDEGSKHSGNKRREPGENPEERPEEEETPHDVVEVSDAYHSPSQPETPTDLVQVSSARLSRTRAETAPTTAARPERHLDIEV